MRKSEVFITKQIKSYLEVVNVNRRVQRSSRNAKKIQTFYQKYLIKSTKKLFFCSERTSWVQQEQNGPKRISKMCSAQKRQKVTTLKLPEISPNGNPIKNMSQYIKMKIKGIAVYTVKQLILKEKKYRDLCEMNTQKISSKV